MRAIKLIQTITLTTIVGVYFISCSKNEIINEKTKIYEFVWGGMNAFYKWQPDIEDLSDKRFTSNNELNSYLNGFKSPESLFNSLTNKSKDTLSLITSNYNTLFESFEGVTITNGLQFSLTRYENKSDSLYGYVRYVVKGSNAASQGIKRGMVFNKINGTHLKISNFKKLLEKNNYSITIADFNDGNPITNKTVYNLTESKIKEEPILTKSVIDNAGEKFGYIAFSRFIPRYDNTINDIFIEFKGVNHLIIDLRYCNSGAFETSTYLASMITGQFKGSLLTDQVWNSKVLENIDVSIRNSYFTTTIDNSFTQKALINSLALKDIYFLTSDVTAAAAEVLINSLKPYINVKVIGSKTAGQFLCNTILFDSDDYNSFGNNFNSSHTWALYPVAFEAFNSRKQNSNNGIFPDIEVYDTPKNMNKLGDISDGMLKLTIDYIKNKKQPVVSNNTIPLWNSEMKNTDYNRMYTKYKPVSVK